jgi:hypothetical protein
MIPSGWVAAERVADRSNAGQASNQTAEYRNMHGCFALSTRSSEHLIYSDFGRGNTVGKSLDQTKRERKKTAFSARAGLWSDKKRKEKKRRGDETRQIKESKR